MLYFFFTPLMSPTTATGTRMIDMGTSEYLRSTNSRRPPAQAADTTVVVLAFFVGFLTLRYLWVQYVLRAKK